MQKLLYAVLMASRKLLHYFTDHEVAAVFLATLAARRDPSPSGVFINDIHEPSACIPKSPIQKHPDAQPVLEGSNPNAQPALGGSDPNAKPALGGSDPVPL